MGGRLLEGNARPDATSGSCLVSRGDCLTASIAHRAE